MKFICGCDLEDKLKKGYRNREQNGKQICPEHGLPEYGYRTTEAVKSGILVDARNPK